MKTYAEYLEENKHKTFSRHMMPAGACPKASKGDTHIGRARLNEVHRKGFITERELPVLKNGLINVSEVKKMRKKIYRIQEAGHGR